MIVQGRNQENNHRSEIEAARVSRVEVHSAQTLFAIA